jgi:hypothetical protein
MKIKNREAQIALSNFFKKLDEKNIVNCRDGGIANNFFYKKQ